MTWFKVDDHFHSHPKVLAAGNSAIGLWVRCGSYCSEHLTDGFVPDGIVKAYGTRSEAARLVDAGMWRPAKGGYRMHDFHDHNPTRDEVLAKRETRADAGRRGGIASGRSRQANDEANA